MIQVCECCKKECSKKFVSRFCSRKYAYLYKHIEGYKKFLEEDNLYCKGNYTPKNFKDFFMEEQNYKCAICGCENTHSQRPLIFILDHIDGDASNNRRSNLRMICPNCDS